MRSRARLAHRSRIPPPRTLTTPTEPSRRAWALRSRNRTVLHARRGVSRRTLPHRASASGLDTVERAGDTSTAHRTVVRISSTRQARLSDVSGKDALHACVSPSHPGHRHRPPRSTDRGLARRRPGDIPPGRRVAPTSGKPAWFSLPMPPAPGLSAVVVGTRGPAASRPGEQRRPNSPAPFLKDLDLLVGISRGAATARKSGRAIWGRIWASRRCGGGGVGGSSARPACRREGADDHAGNAGGFTAAPLVGGQRSVTRRLAPARPSC